MNAQVGYVMIVWMQYMAMTIITGKAEIYRARACCSAR